MCRNGDSEITSRILTIDFELETRSREFAVDIVNFARSDFLRVFEQIDRANSHPLSLPILGKTLRAPLCTAAAIMATH